MIQQHNYIQYNTTDDPSDRSNSIGGAASILNLVVPILNMTSIFFIFFAKQYDFDMVLATSH